MPASAPRTPATPSMSVATASTSSSAAAAKRVHFATAPTMFTYSPHLDAHDDLAADVDAAQAQAEAERQRTPSPSWSASSDEDDDYDHLEDLPDTPPSVAASFASGKGKSPGLGFGLGKTLRQRFAYAPAAPPQPHAKPHRHAHAHAHPATTKPRASASASASTSAAAPKHKHSHSTAGPPPTPNPLLATLAWDVRAPPAHARAHNPTKGGKAARPPHPLSATDLAAPLALVGGDNNDPLTAAVGDVEIHVAQLPPLWAPIRLSPSPSSSSKGTGGTTVTVAQVLAATHAHLHARVSAAEWRALPPVPQQAASVAFWARIDARAREAVAAGAPPHVVNAEVEREKDAGLRRVDVLGGHTRFVTLAPPRAREGGGAWTLVLARP